MWVRVYVNIVIYIDLVSLSFFVAEVVKSAISKNELCWSIFLKMLNIDKQTISSNTLHFWGPIRAIYRSPFYLLPSSSQKYCATSTKTPKYMDFGAPMVGKLRIPISPQAPPRPPPSQATCPTPIDAAAVISFVLGPSSTVFCFWCTYDSCFLPNRGRWRTIVHNKCPRWDPRWIVKRIREKTPKISAKKWKSAGPGLLRRCWTWSCQGECCIHLFTRVGSRGPCRYYFVL